MKLRCFRFFLPLIPCCLGSAALCADSKPTPYSVVSTLPVGGAGRWDYITCDPAAKLLYVPRSTHVMVLSADDGKQVADIPDTSGVHGVALVPEMNRGFASDGEDGTVTVFDMKSHTVLGKVKAAADTDGIIYDPVSKMVLTGCGDSDVAIAIPADVDPTKGDSAAKSLDLGGKPEFLAADGAGHAFVNIADKNEVVEFDPLEMKQLARWSIAPGTKPTSMAIDPAHHLLFVGCRNKMLIILNTETGKIVSTLPIGKGVDATAFDGGTIFVSCGDGTLWVINEETPAEFKTVQTLTTVPGARTLAVDSSTHKIYLPAADLKPADPDKPKARPEPVPDTFKIVVVAPTK
jgi:DNA-binding beta-propeller fold protein YncE